MGAAEFGLVACGTALAPTPRSVFDSCTRFLCLASCVPSATRMYTWLDLVTPSVCPELGYASRGPTAEVPNMASPMPL